MVLVPALVPDEFLSIDVYLYHLLPWLVPDRCGTSMVPPAADTWLLCYRRIDHRICIFCMEPGKEGEDNFQILPSFGLYLPHPAVPDRIHGYPDTYFQVIRHATGNLCKLYVAPGMRGSHGGHICGFLQVVTPGIQAYGTLLRQPEESSTTEAV